MNFERLIIAWNSCFTTPVLILISLEWLIPRTLPPWKQWTEKIRINYTVQDSESGCFVLMLGFFCSFSKCGALNETCILCEAACVSCTCCKLPLHLLAVILLLPLLNRCWFQFASLLQVSFFGIELYKKLTSVTLLTPNRLWASWCWKYSSRTGTYCVLSWSYSCWLSLFLS